VIGLCEPVSVNRQVATYGRLRGASIHPEK
jgi:hypothetical protein